MCIQFEDNLFLLINSWKSAIGNSNLLLLGLLSVREAKWQLYWLKNVQYRNVNPYKSAFDSLWSLAEVCINLNLSSYTFSPYVNVVEFQEPWRNLMPRQAPFIKEIIDSFLPQRWLLLETIPPVCFPVIGINVLLTILVCKRHFHSKWMKQPIDLTRFRFNDPHHIRICVICTLKMEEFEHSLNGRWEKKKFWSKVRNLGRT